MTVDVSNHAQLIVSVVELGVLLGIFQRMGSHATEIEWLKKTLTKMEGKLV